MTPFGHQREAVEAVAKVIGPGGRCQVIHACGTGKTETARWCVDALGTGRVAFMAPSIALLGQAWHRWAGMMGWRGRGIACCSDPTSKADDSIRIADAVLPAVSTDARTIARFLAAGPGVVFCTYASAEVLADAARDVGGLDLIICDESHHLAGRTDGAYSSVLDDDKMPAARRLFMTATPKVFDARKGDAHSMDDPSKFGAVAHRFSFAEAIKAGRLTEYGVIVFSVSDPRIGKYLDDPDGADAATAAGVAKALQAYSMRRVITFHSRIARAESFAARLRTAASCLPEDERPELPIVAAHVWGRQPLAERRAVMSLLDAEGQHGIVANAKCCAEGVDVPALDAVVIVDPRSSHIEIVQIVGRAMRLSPGKRKGWIVLPVYVGPGESVDDVMRSSRYRHVADVLRALREHDPRFEGSLKQWAAHEGKGILEFRAGDEDGPTIDTRGLPTDLVAAIRPVVVRDSSTDPVWMVVTRDPMLGKERDGATAARHKCSLATVRRARDSLGISAMVPRNAERMAKLCADPMLGKEPEQVTAQRYGCHWAVVRRARTKMGLAPFSGPKRHYVRREMSECIVRDLDAGDGTLDIAQRYGVATTTVLRHARASGRSRREKVLPRWDDVVRLLDEGVSRRQIAKMVGMSKGGVQYIANSRQRAQLVSTACATPDQ